jgi:hypothetical protein
MSKRIDENPLGGFYLEPSGKLDSLFSSPNTSNFSVRPFDRVEGVS